jgi:FkbM family methyltransferase
MISLAGLCKPQYLFRPSQIYRRLRRELRPRTSRELVRLPWQMQIDVDLSDTVGRAIAAQGIYDIITTEVLWRLTAPGDLTMDAGANIGYMTSILAVRSGPSGQVHAFEPHPETFLLLQKNAARWNEAHRYAPITLHQAAVSNANGTAMLDIPSDGGRSASQAYLTQRSNGSGFPVATIRLEQFMPVDRPVGVLKMDLQSHEAAAIGGLGVHLKQHKIRDIIYEEESGFPAESHDLLRAAGYHILWFEERLTGVRLVSPGDRVKKRPYDILPSFLATINPARAIDLLGARGWQSF